MIAPKCQQINPEAYRLNWHITTTKYEKHVHNTTHVWMIKEIIYSDTTGPCLTRAIWRCRKNSSQLQRSFQWKLRSHWLKFLRQRHVAVVRQDPRLAMLVIADTMVRMRFLDRGPFHWRYFNRNSKSVEVRVADSFPSIYITTKFCRAVMSCTIFCNDHVIQHYIRRKRNFHLIWDTMENISWNGPQIGCIISVSYWGIMARDYCITNILQPHVICSL